VTTHLLGQHNTGAVGGGGDIRRRGPSELQGDRIVCTGVTSACDGSIRSKPTRLAPRTKRVQVQGERRHQRVSLAQPLSIEPAGSCNYLRCRGDLQSTRPVASSDDPIVRYRLLGPEKKLDHGFYRLLQHTSAKHSREFRAVAKAASGGVRSGLRLEIGTIRKSLCESAVFSEVGGRPIYSTMLFTQRFPMCKWLYKRVRSCCSCATHKTHSPFVRPQLRISGRSVVDGSWCRGDCSRIHAVLHGSGLARHI